MPEPIRYTQGSFLGPEGALSFEINNPHIQYGSGSPDSKGHRPHHVEEILPAMNKATDTNPEEIPFETADNFDEMFPRNRTPGGNIYWPEHASVQTPQEDAQSQNNSPPRGETHRAHEAEPEEYRTVRLNTTMIKWAIELFEGGATPLEPGRIMPLHIESDPKARWERTLSRYEGTRLHLLDAMMIIACSELRRQYDRAPYEYGCAPLIDSTIVRSFFPTASRKFCDTVAEAMDDHRNGSLRNQVSKAWIQTSRQFTLPESLELDEKTRKEYENLWKHPLIDNSGMDMMHDWVDVCRAQPDGPQLLLNPDRRKQIETLVICNFLLPDMNGIRDRVQLVSQFDVLVAKVLSNPFEPVGPVYVYDLKSSLPDTNSLAMKLQATLLSLVAGAYHAHSPVGRPPRACHEPEPFILYDLEMRPEYLYTSQVSYRTPPSATGGLDFYEVQMATRESEQRRLLDKLILLIRSIHENKDEVLREFRRARRFQPPMPKLQDEDRSGNNSGEEISM